MCSILTLASLQEHRYLSETLSMPMLPTHKIYTYSFLLNI